MNKKIVRILALSITLASMLALAACGPQAGGNPPISTPDPTSTAALAKQEAADERAEYEAALKTVDVFADSGELVQIDNLVASYIAVATEDLEDMVAYEAAAIEERLSTHLFIGKLKTDAATGEIQQQLAMTGINLIGDAVDGAEVEVAISQGYIIMAAAANGSDIVNKFALVLDNNEIENIAAIYAGLRQDLTA